MAIGSIVRGTARAAGSLAAAYATYAGVAWLRYGRHGEASAAETDPLLDRFMPEYDVVERYHIDVAAPADITFAAACDVDLTASPITRAIFRAREWILRAEHDTTTRPKGALELTRSIGWTEMAFVPGREVVMASVTKPWDPHGHFRSIAPDAYRTFAEPDYVKIAWTLRADPIDAHHSVFRHETRVLPTDPIARAKFRTYWAFFSPGIKLIRALLLEPIRREAERRGAERDRVATERRATMNHAP